MGLDLVSVPQIMIARPLVAGAGAGLIVGDLGAGLVIGLLFELFQYDILPVGAVRYPEYGPATIAAVTVAHTVAHDDLRGIGLACLAGLVTAMIGGQSLHLLRRLNARVVHAADRRLESGDPRVLVRLHAAAIARDAARAALVTALGLTLAAGVGAAFAWTIWQGDGPLLAGAAVAAALAAAAAGVLRMVGARGNLPWLAVGLIAGGLVTWLR